MKPVGVTTFENRLIVVGDDGSVWKMEDEGRTWSELSPLPGSIRQSDTNRAAFDTHMRREQQKPR